MKSVVQLFVTILSFFVGKINYIAAPPWLKFIQSQQKTNPAPFIILLLLVILLPLGYQYYLNLSESELQPVTIKASVISPKLTGNNLASRPDKLHILFSYDIKANSQTRPSGYPSVARIDLINKSVSRGIKMTPFIAGSWNWGSDRQLTFEAEKDWPAGTEFNVAFSPEIFAPDTNLTKNNIDFKTKKFEVSIANLQFYQEPKNEKTGLLGKRKVVATLKFTHPVDKKSLKEHIALQMRPSGSSVSTQAENFDYTLTYSKTLREAYLHSEYLTLPQHESFMKLVVKPGTKSLLGGKASKTRRDAKVVIPSVYSFLQVKQSNIKIVRNENKEPEQVLTLEFTDEINELQLKDKLAVYLLPIKNSKRNRRYWSSPSEIDSKVLQAAKPQPLNLFANPRADSKQYNLKLDVPENRYVYVKIKSKLTSVNQFVKQAAYDQIIKIPAYPKEIVISGEGSVLSLSGEKKLTLLTRGLSELKISVAKIKDSDINHLISQSNGDMTNPYFTNYRFSFANIAEYEQDFISLNKVHAKKANYAAVDLAKYIKDPLVDTGLFYVEVKGWDKTRNSEIYNVHDSRLILVTDLGVIVKKNADRSGDLFVQSIHSGNPVPAAIVELLGKNGVPLFSLETDDTGHVKIPDTSNYYNERQPTVYVIKKSGDLSFMPFDNHARQLNYSKFSVGGVYSNYYQTDSLAAFGFSDRGIYRPGETANLAFIVKNADLSNVENIPLSVSVTGPKGNQILRKRIMLNEKGLFDISVATELSSDTGFYQTNLRLITENNRLGRVIGSTHFKVEEFKPDTLKIVSKITHAMSQGWITSDKLTADISLNNLFGTPAQDRKVTARFTVSPTRFKFKQYQEYVFSNPFSHEKDNALYINENLPGLRTDHYGKAKFNIPLSRFTKGAYKLNFFTQGFEQGGGRSVSAANQVLISPLTYLLGSKVDGDLNYVAQNAKRTVNFVLIDSQLKQISHDKLTLKTIAINQYSTLIKQPNGTYKYQTVSREKELTSQAFKVNSSETSLELDTTKIGNFAYEIYDQQHNRLTRVNYSVIGAGNLAGKLDKNTQLEVKLNSDHYAGGDTIEMNIKAPFIGAGLITIESDKVLTHKWFKTTEHSTIETIKVPENVEGTAYVNVSFIRDVASKEIYTSPLSYAVVPFSINRQKRIIDVSLAVDEIVRPGADMKIKYKASRPAKMVVFAVDEGILQVANYQTPKPLDHFLRKKALEVETLQILDLILPEFDLFKSLSASGGGSATERKLLAKNLNPFTRKQDKPAVYWSGIIDGTEEFNTVNFKVPDTFSGKLRVMAVAVADDAMGVGQTANLVRGPFVISPAVLQQAAPGDEFDVSVGIANLIENSPKNAKITVNLSLTEHLEVIGKNNKVLQISEGSEKTAHFKVKAKQKLGAANITFNVSYSGEHKIEAAKRSASLSIRPAVTYQTSFTSGVATAGSTEIDIPRSLFPRLASQSVAASASPLILVDGLSDYLKNYPHGCTEQMVSKVFPIIGLMSHQGFKSKQTDIGTHFSAVIRKLRQRQLTSGGFAFWPGGSNVAEYPTVYAVHFLLEAKSQGFPVPDDILNRAKTYLKRYVANSAQGLIQARNRANAIYLLTKLGVVTTNYLVDLQDDLESQYKEEWRSDITAIYMAATYVLLQKEAHGIKLLADYEIGKHILAYQDDFHSGLTLDAQYLYLMAKHFKSQAKDIDAEHLLTLIKPIFKGQYNTIASAYSILALGAYSELLVGDGSKDEAIEFSEQLHDQQFTKLDAKKSPFLTAKYALNALKIKMKSEQDLYYLNLQTGFDRHPTTEALSDNLEVFREYFDDNNQVVTEFEQGKELTVKLKIRTLNNKWVSNIAVIDLLPGGFEVVSGSAANNRQVDYTDIREDRVVFYGSFGSQIQTLTYRVKLTASGKFNVPAVYAESMYDRQIKASSVAGQFVVKPSL